MTRTNTCSISFATILALAACTPSGSDMNAIASTPADRGDGAQYHHNPAPKQAYQVTMTIKDAPGPFSFMRALAQYDVVNKECLSPPEHNPGGRTAPVPTEDIEIPLKKVSEDQYTGTVYADQMLDQDFGSGVCHWKLVQLRVHMKVSGNKPGEAQLIPSIPSEKLLAEAPEVVYFNKLSYGDIDEETPPIDFGESDRSRFGPSLADADLFTVTFAPVKESAK